MIMTIILHSNSRRNRYHHLYSHHHHQQILKLHPRQEGGKGNHPAAIAMVVVGVVVKVAKVDQDERILPILIAMLIRTTATVMVMIDVVVGMIIKRRIHHPKLMT